jgi:pSer/pThr/pTyr-binding forkhead associated (FHA) protein
MDVRLILVKSDGERKQFPLANPETVIGRGENCQLRVPLASVSRQHCRISVAGERIFVRDLESANGTYVNNDRVKEAELAAGDRLNVGPVRFTLLVDGVSERPVSAEDKGEEVVELEADVLDELDANDDLAAALEADLSEESHDPIAALEALAAEGDSDKKEDPSQQTDTA